MTVVSDQKVLMKTIISNETLNQIKNEQTIIKKELNTLSACPTVNCDGKGNLNPKSKSRRHWSAKNCPNKQKQSNKFS